MSLLKKTVVLTKEGKPKGYVTVVRVGDEAGAKIVGDGFTGDAFAYVKIGKVAQTTRLAGKRTEIELTARPAQDDSVSCLVARGGVLLAKGGKDLAPKEVDAFLESAYAPERGSEAKAPAEEDRPQEEDRPDVEAEKTAEKIAQGPAQGPAQDPAQETGKENGSSESVEETERAEAKEEAQEETVGEVRPREDSPQDERKKKDLTEEEELLERLGRERSGYYVGIKDKVDELFVVYPQENALPALIPDSEWVKVRYDGDEYYVVGKLYDGEKVRYLGYGVPGVENVRPPKVADGLANWFPIPDLTPYDGYWLFFQDAETGKIER